MLYKRYGRVKFQDCATSWIAVFLLFAITILSLWAPFPWWLSVIPFLFAVAILWDLLSSIFETFSVRDNKFYIKRGLRSAVTDIPPEVLVIVSAADIRQMGRTRTSYREETHMLTGRFAVSILRHTTVQEAVDRLHRPPLKPYTNSMVEGLFEEYRFVYSFVYEQDAVTEALDGRKYQIIIPESLLNKVPASLLTTDVFIDKGY